MDGLRKWLFPVIFGVIMTGCGLWILADSMRLRASHKVIVAPMPLLAQLSAERAVRLKELRAASVYVYPDIPQTRLYLEPTTPDAFRDGTRFGSGVIISPEGDMLTAAHVIEGTCLTKDQTLTDDVYCAIVNIGHTRVYRAKLVKYDQETDIAHLKILKTQHDEVFAAVPLSRAQDDDVLEGREVLINGIPFGTANMAVMGMISNAEDRDEVCKGGIRVSIPVASGNSGGAVFDVGFGAVVGVVVTVQALGSKDGRNTAFLTITCAVSPQQIRSFLN